MSFVLDALKLSEKRRSRFARPVYAHPPPAHRVGRRGRWFFLLATVPIVAGIYLTWRLVVPPQSAPPPAAAEHEALAAGPAPATIDGREASGDFGPAIPGGDPSASTGEEQPPPEVPVSAVADWPAAQVMHPVDPLPFETAPADWPALTLQMLFFSPESSRSFVQINGRNYRVGEYLDDGPQVLEIAPNGVILAHRGKKVLLAMDR